jgi:FkbM family methyltransferase
MKRFLLAAAKTLIVKTNLALFPVRVRGGIAAGARWTLYPWTSYWRGTHEPAVQAALLALGGGNISGWSCWDLGAHYGLYSVGLARRVGPQGQVAAFEPNPLSFARLQRHTRMNALTWLKPYCAAVSDEEGSAELFTYGDLGTTTTHLPYEGENRTSHVGAIDVPLLRLDALVARGEIRAPQFVKIDVEGHGHHALRGMRETLRTAKPIVLAAFHSPQEVSGMLELIESLGYQRTQIGHSDSTDPIIGRDFLFTPPS